MDTEYAGVYVERGNCKGNARGAAEQYRQQVPCWSEIATVGVVCQSVGIIIIPHLDLPYIYSALYCAANTGPSLRLRVVTDGKLPPQNIPIDYFFPN